MHIKFLICEVPYVILLSLEEVGGVALVLIDTLMYMEYPLFLLIFVFRRIVLKLVLLLAIKFLLNNSIYDNYREVQKYWYFLGAICFLNLLS